MIDSFGIYKKADNIIKTIGSRDTLLIAKELGIKIYYQDFKYLLGMYTCRWKHRIIILNNRLDIIGYRWL